MDRGGGNVALILFIIALERIDGAFDAERIKPTGTIGIVRNDGTVLFRSPMNEKAIIHSTDEAIVGKSLEGIINSWNPGRSACLSRN